MSPTCRRLAGNPRRRSGGRSGRGRQTRECTAWFRPGSSGEWWIAASVLRDAAALAGIEALPWDRWSVARSFHGARTVSPEQARNIDALAEALDPAPSDRTQAAAVLERFPWAAPSGTDLEVLHGSLAP
jgi:hypothetical protein